MGLLSIDPGVQAGWAYFNDDSLLLHHGVIQYPNQTGKRDDFQDWKRRADLVMTCLEGIIKLPDVNVTDLVCEWPFYHETEGGREVARSGGLVKLSVMVGRIAQFAFHHDFPITFVEVGQWKGQLSKPAVIHRVTKRLLNFGLEMDQINEIKTHAWDAIGIGLFALGKF